MAVSRGSGRSAEARELGAELRALRTAAGINTRDLADKVGVSNANISHWETGGRLVPLERLTDLLDALQVDDDQRERLVGLRRRADGPGELVSGVPSIGAHLAQLVDLERVANRITAVSPLLLPGLLQTSDYARAVLGEGPDTETKVALRVGRREVLTRRRDPAELVAFIDSEVLTRPVAPPEVMVEQLDHLVEMSGRPNITLHLIPSTMPGFHPGLAGPFILLEFPTATPVVHLEHHRSSGFLWEPADVSAFIKALDEIQKVAMTPDRTSEVINEIARGMETE
jgi:transcriptional regulator with XRE-family HTH domain